MGNPSNTVRAKALFVHNDQDDTTSPCHVYAELPALKAFPTFRGAGHSNTFGDSEPAPTSWIGCAGVRTARRPPAIASLATQRPPAPAGRSGLSDHCAPGWSISTTYRTVNSWAGCSKAEVTVKAGSAPIDGWIVQWTLAGGQAIRQLWNGTLTTSATAVSFASYSGPLAAHVSTTFGSSHQAHHRRLR